MPKFSDHEKEVIDQELLVKGQLLFEQNGLFKVTIDNLTLAAGISKGSFYAFYESKEHLFMKINNLQQQALFQQIEKFIEKNTNKEQAVELVKEVFIKTIDTFISNPFLSKIDSEVVRHLERKLGQPLFEQLNYKDEKLLQLLSNTGIKFLKPDHIIVKALRGILAAALFYKLDEDYAETVELLCEGLAHQII